MKKMSIRKADRFRRVRNNTEAVYETPSFFRKETGIGIVTESGIFQNGEGHTKAYEVDPAMGVSDMPKFCESFDGMDLQLIYWKEEEKKYLILHSDHKLLSDAQKQFGMMEEELQECAGRKLNGNCPAGINLQSRLKLYGQFLAGMLGEEYVVGDPVSETETWKAFSRLEHSEERGYSLKTAAGFYSVLAVRRFPYIPEGSLMSRLTAPECVIASATEAVRVSNLAVAEYLKEHYYGLDGVLARMKRKNYDLYRILVENAPEDEESFVRGSVYLLLRAEDEERMQESIRQVKDMAKENQIFLEERICKIREAAAIFGISGGSQEHLGRLVPRSEMNRFFPLYQKERTKESYNVEEMKQLFFKGVRNEEA